MSDFYFDITKPATWNLASNRQLVWDGLPLYNADSGKPLSEKDMVGFFETTFAFLERNGDKLPLGKKQQAIRTVLDRMKTTNTKSTIEQRKQQKQEREASKGKTKVPIRCNFIREDKKFDGKCWKCGSSIPSEFEGKYQCPFCGFITFHIDGKYMDEWEHWDLDEARVMCSSAHKYKKFLENKLGKYYDHIEESCAGLPEFSKINIIFSTLIKSLNGMSKIDYQDLYQVYSEYSRFLIEHGAYFYEALYNSQICNLLSRKELGTKKVKAVCHIPCQKKCTQFPACDIDEAIQHSTFPKRDALDTWYVDYDDTPEAISAGYVIGYCHGEWEECLESSSALYDAAMAKLE